MRCSLGLSPYGVSAFQAVW